MVSRWVPKLCATPWPICVALTHTEPVSALTYALYIAALSGFLSLQVSLKTCQKLCRAWCRMQSFNSKDKHLSSTALEHLESGQGPCITHMC